MFPGRVLANLSLSVESLHTFQNSRASLRALPALRFKTCRQKGLKTLDPNKQRPLEIGARVSESRSR